jgi:hypothetical protein
MHDEKQCTLYVYARAAQLFTVTTAAALRQWRAIYGLLGVFLTDIVRYGDAKKESTKSPYQVY